MLVKARAVGLDLKEIQVVDADSGVFGQVTGVGVIYVAVGRFKLGAGVDNVKPDEAKKQYFRTCAAARDSRCGRMDLDMAYFDADGAVCPSQVPLDVMR